ncbi:MAG: ABC transporter permease [Candidatus Moduliflexus flocculans]|nr:ABC transporter permease [Candidatus Moduliflexus flocculans]
MLKNYLKTAWRNILKSKGFSILNIAGLAVGLAVCLLILLYVRAELSYDAYHAYADRIYRVQNAWLNPDGSIQGEFSTLAPSYALLLRNDFPEIERLARMWNRTGTIIKAGDRTFTEERFFFAEPEIFDILTLPFVQGDPATALKDVGGIVLSQTTARKYFGDADPMGRGLILPSADNMEFRVTGVMEDVPAHSHIHFDFLASYITLKGLSGSGDADYFHGTRNFSDNVTAVYVRLATPDGGRALQAKMPAFLDQSLSASGGRAGAPGQDKRVADPPRPEGQGHPPLRPHPVRFRAGRRHPDRAPVHGHRPVHPGHRLRQLRQPVHRPRHQAGPGGRAAQGRRRRRAGRWPPSSSASRSSSPFSRSCWPSGWWSSPCPPSAASSGMPFGAGAVFSPAGLGLFAAGFLLTGLAAGVYPALYLAAFRPSTILRGELTRGRGGAGLRKALVVFQFAISIALIFSVTVITRQTRFLRTADVGYARDNIICVPVETAVSPTLDGHEGRAPPRAVHPGGDPVQARARGPAPRRPGLLGRGRRANGSRARSACPTTGSSRTSSRPTA